MPGDHKHTDNSINRDFINFNMNKLTQVQNAKKSDFAKYNIHEIINGSLKADDEINHSISSIYLIGCMGEFFATGFCQQCRHDGCPNRRS